MVGMFVGHRILLNLSVDYLHRKKELSKPYRPANSAEIVKVLVESGAGNSRSKNTRFGCGSWSEARIDPRSYSFPGPSPGFVPRSYGSLLNQAETKSRSKRLPRRCTSSEKKSQSRRRVSALIRGYSDRSTGLNSRRATGPFLTRVTHSGYPSRRMKLAATTPTRAAV